MSGGTVHVNGIFVEITQHKRAFERGNEDRRYLVCVYSGANLLALYAFVHNPLNGGAPIIHGSSRAISKHLIGIISLDRRIHNRAATGNRGVLGFALKDGDDGLETLYGVELTRQRMAYALLNQSIGVIERFQGQLFFTGEMIIDA